MSGIKAKITHEIKSVKRDLIVTDVLIIVCGLLLVLFPETSGSIICRVIGAALCVWGLVCAAGYFLRGEFEVLGSFALVQGAALLGFGIYFLVRPQFLEAFLTVALAIILMVSGVMKFQYAADFARLKVTGWWIELIGAAVMCVLGVVTLVNPFEAAAALMMFIGISFLADGIWDLVSVLYLSHKAKKLRDTIEDTVTYAEEAAKATEVPYTDYKK